MLRAWLLAASLAATVVDLAVIAAVGVFGVPERVFEATPFRVGVLVVIVLALVVIRTVARFAFRSAVATQHAIVRETPCQTVSISADCPLRLLVVFHLRLKRARLALAP
ncbi:MAG TPA: hypothetical protein VGG24_21550 [Paraburkholderia sp.]